MLIITWIAALLPAVLLWLYIWRRDPKKEPFKQLLKAVLFGAAICVPVAFVEYAISSLVFGEGGPLSLIGTTFNAFFVAALPEEAFKLLALWLVLRRNPYFDEHFDGIVYAVCVGLGFAAVENVAYVVGQDAWASIAVSRALLAVPGHYAFAVLMGYYYALYHFVDHSTRTATKILLVPVMAHGIYDSLAMSAEVNPLIGGIAFLILIYFCIKMHRVAYSHLTNLIRRDTL
jgi:RsiW-degrading membrane proteinase PrsW (M82 family)